MAILSHPPIHFSSVLNLFDVYKALTALPASKTARSNGSHFRQLGKPREHTARLVREGDGAPVKLLHTKLRLGSSQRREQLKKALSLMVVWSLFQSLEPVGDATISFFLPFYGSIKTILLLWVFFARTAASTSLLTMLIQPVMRPYEGTIDSILGAVLSLFFNVMFLCSIPISRLSRNIGNQAFVQRAYQLLPWTKQAQPKAEKPVRANGIKKAAERVPPPSSIRKPPKPSEGGGGGTALKTGSSANGPGQLRKAPSLDRLRLPSTESSRQRTVSLGRGKPPLSGSRISSSGRSASTSSAAIAAASTPSTAPIPSQSGSQTFRSLQDLPPPPSGFQVAGASGGFAFIPSTPTQSTRAKLSPAMPNLLMTPSLIFSPIVPGAFAPTPGLPKQPLKMPVEARAKKTKSSITTNHVEAERQGKKKAEPKQSKKVKAAEVSKVLSKMDIDDSGFDRNTADQTALFLGSSDSEGGDDAVEPVKMNASPSTPAKRKVSRPRVDSAPTASTPIRAKKARLEVLEDVAAADEEMNGGPARRTRGASQSRASSVAAEERPESGQTNGSREEEQEKAKPPTSRIKASSSRQTLRPSASSKTLRKPPMRVPLASFPSDEVVPTKTTIPKSKSTVISANAKTRTVTGMTSSRSIRSIPVAQGSGGMTRSSTRSRLAGSQQ